MDEREVPAHSPCRAKDRHLRETGRVGCLDADAEPQPGLVAEVAGGAGVPSRGLAGDPSFRSVQHGEPRDAFPEGVQGGRNGRDRQMGRPDLV